MRMKVMNFNGDVETDLGQVQKCLRIIRKARKTQRELQTAFSCCLFCFVCLFLIIDAYFYSNWKKADCFSMEVLVCS